jgi:peptidoglycan hydrolase-like protein with peptidoglycan-binding domain
MNTILKIFAFSLLFATLSWSAPHNLVAKVQTELLQLGYDPGEIDGLIGPNTRRAIKQFQRDIGRRQTGRITKGLLWQLRNAQNSSTAGFSQEAEELNGIKEPD